MKAYTANIPQRLAALLLCAALLLPAFGGTALAARAEEPAPGQSYTQPEGDISTPATAAGEESEDTAPAGANDAAAEGVQGADEAAEPAAPAPETETPAPATVPAAAGVAACTNAVATYALDDAARDGETLEITISHLTGPEQVRQPSASPTAEYEKHNIQFQFRLTCNELGGFQREDTISVSTNLGELFGVENDDWSYLSNLGVWGDAVGEIVYANVKVEPDWVTFTIAEDAVGRTTLQGIVTIPANLIGRDMGATPDQPVTKTLQIDDQTWDIEFVQVQEPASGGTAGAGFPDVDRFWKNYHSVNINGAPSNGATATIEVNPIGSLDLYGSTTYPEDGPRYPSMPVFYENFVVEDTIPENGHIDLDSVYISASIPHLMMAEVDLRDQDHGDDVTVGGYDVPAGTYYAQRDGTGRPSIKHRMTRLTQKPGETLDEFRERIKSQQLQWGVYFGDPDLNYPGKHTETFICNLGNIGDPENNNGILYKDFKEKGKEYAADYPEIFGDEGVTGGNVVSYYIEFKTYFTSPGQTHNVSNYGSWKTDGARREGHGSNPSTGGGNWGTCQIGEYRSFGDVEAKNLELRLVDADFPDQPISGASFKLQQKDGAGNWVDTDLTGKTDSNGYLTMQGLVPGDYKLVQTTSAEGYLFGEDTYNADPDAIGANFPVAKNGVFTVSANDTKGFATVVTNRKVLDLTVTKVWDDGENRDVLRPDSVTVTVYKNGTELQEIALTEDAEWTATVQDLPVYENGKAISYTVDELTVPAGYTKSIAGSAANGYTITNTHLTDTLDIPVQKVWDDGGDRDGLRPDSVTVQLLRNGQEVQGKKLILTETDDWQGAFANLPRYDDQNQKIAYTVAETPARLPQGYTSAVTGSAAAGFTITNTHKPETTSVAVTKVWDDDGDRDGVRPPAVVIELLANGYVANTCYLTNSTATDADTWTHTFTGLPKYENGKEITYAVREQTVEDYAAEITGNAKTGFTVTNTHKPQTLAITVEKVWNDNNDQDGKRPDSVTVTLKADGEEVAEGTVRAADNWTYTFQNMPRLDGGKVIEYTLAEDQDQPNLQETGYALVDIKRTENGETAQKFVVTNAHTPEQRAIQVTKVWDDNDDQDGLRPASVTFHLKADGVDTGKTLQLPQPDGTWSGTFSALDRYKAGKEIQYTVTEDAVTGYTPEVTDTMAEGFTVTNTHAPAMRTLTLTKVWDDDSDRDGLRPQSVEIIVLADDKPAGAVKLTAADASADNANVWTRTVEYPVYEAGKKLTYTVAENTVSGYEEPVITGDAETGFTVTNRHVPAPESTPGNTPSGTTPTPTPAPAPQPEPASAPQTAAVIPQTGDDAPVGLWTALAIAAAAALAGLLFYRYKKNR